MADQTFTEKTGSTQTAFEGANRTAKSAADQALSAGRNLKDKASEYASSSGDTIREQASDYIDAAKEAGADAADRLKELIDAQKGAGARYVDGIAEAIRRAAREFDNDLPFAGTYLRKAASQVDAVSESVKQGHFNDLLSEAQDFARKQPAAFLGLTVLAGFGLVRLLKSSSRDTSSTDYSEMASGRSGMSPGRSEMNRSVNPGMGQDVNPGRSQTANSGMGRSTNEYAGAPR